MKPKILTARGSFPTARNLRQEIEEITGIHYSISANASECKDVLFRYGNHDPVSGNDSNINSREFIELASQKGVFDCFCRANEIYSPIYHANTDIPETFPIVIRKTLTGFGGKGIIVCNSLEEFNRQMNSSYYWTPFVKCGFELRVHLFGNKINRLYKKTKEGDETNPTPIRNAQSGYHFSLRDEGLEKYPKLVPLCEKLGNLLLKKGGYFCAVDIGWDSITHQYFVFEINSAPGLNSVNVSEYAKYICEILKLGGERGNNE